MTESTSESTMDVRRIIASMDFNQPSVKVSVPGMTADELAAYAVRFGRLKRIGVQATPVGDGVALTRVEFTANPSMYPEIDALKVGQSHLFKLPTTMHQRIRLAASNRSRQGRGAFSCTREGDALRVTRLPLTEAEAAACGPLAVATRVLKYDLERLSSTRELRFEVPRPEEAKLRLAAHRQGVKTGWPIRCRRQDDGSMLVYRTDMPAQAAGDDSDKLEPSTSAASPR